ncbi:hypothetical protein K490DRAFT_55291 [Saccharata proteae CBS 121410]|uniref:Uncharacterized protein n=1 Tax=Saccharata proteae CBS 121410 TaxID=1314787 RepID=A0A6A5YFX1_9PEZI|nr:hypothetical protein K490DRAFT_55291 [Saccharata proteae CBS 121410]
MAESRPDWDKVSAVARQSMVIPLRQHPLDLPGRGSYTVAPDAIARATGSHPEGGILPSDMSQEKLSDAEYRADFVAAMRHSPNLKTYQAGLRIVGEELMGWPAALAIMPRIMLTKPVHGLVQFSAWVPLEAVIYLRIGKTPKPAIELKQAELNSITFKNFRAGSTTILQSEWTDVAAKRSHMWNVKFKNTVLENVTFDDCLLSYVFFEDCTLKDVRFKDMDWGRCSFRGVTIDRSEISDSFLHRTKWSSIEICSSNVRRMNMENKRLDQIQVIDVNSTNGIADSPKSSNSAGAKRQFEDVEMMEADPMSEAHQPSKLQKTRVTSDSAPVLPLKPRRKRKHIAEPTTTTKVHLSGDDLEALRRTRAERKRYVDVAWSDHLDAPPRPQDELDATLLELPFVCSTPVLTGAKVESNGGGHHSQHTSVDLCSSIPTDKKLCSQCGRSFQTSLLLKRHFGECRQPQNYWGKDRLDSADPSRKQKASYRLWHLDRQEYSQWNPGERKYQRVKLDFAALRQRIFEHVMPKEFILHDALDEDAMLPTSQTSYNLRTSGVTARGITYRVHPVYTEDEGRMAWQKRGLYGILTLNKRLYEEAARTLYSRHWKFLGSPQSISAFCHDRLQFMDRLTKITLHYRFKDGTVAGMDKHIDIRSPKTEELWEWRRAHGILVHKCPKLKSVELVVDEEIWDEAKWSKGVRHVFLDPHGLENSVGDSERRSGLQNTARFCGRSNHRCPPTILNLSIEGCVGVDRLQKQRELQGLMQRVMTYHPFAEKEARPCRCTGRSRKLENACMLEYVKFEPDWQKKGQKGQRK